jgi:uncharacterized membrane protein
MSTDRVLQSWPDLIKIAVALALVASPWYFGIGMHTETWILVAAALAVVMVAAWSLAKPSANAHWGVVVLAVIAGLAPWIDRAVFASSIARASIGVMALALVALAAYDLYRLQSGKGGSSPRAHASA